ncbi:hypothetical protein [Micromonospora sp. L32]|uniref:hypothetical protein n=1 Tax=Micromonospora sp. L32 TaxID=3452214 RepID=UPI003F8CB857
MTTLSPHRIGFLQYVRAELATALDIPTHPGADDHWHPLTDLRQPAVSRPTDVPTAVIPAIRPPIAAIADVAYELVDDPHLGVLPIGPQVPAHIHDELIGAQR